jgi:hypothetical protein
MGVFVKGKEKVIADTNEQIREAIAKGFKPTTTTVTLFDEDGKKLTVPATELENVLKLSTVGARAQTIQEAQAGAQQSRKIKEFGGTAEGFRAFGEAGLRTITGGLSDFAFDPEDVKAREELHPVPVGIGSTVGIATTLGGAGATGIAGKVLSKTPLGWASRAATNIAKARPGITGRILEGAIDSGALSVGQTVSDIALDKPITTESVIASLGTNVLLGAGLGGVFGAIEKFGPRLVSRAASRLDEDLPLGTGGKDVNNIFSKTFKRMDELSSVSVAEMKKSLQEAKSLGGLSDDVVKLEKLVDDLSASKASMAKKFGPDQKYNYTRFIRETPEEVVKTIQTVDKHSTFFDDIQSEFPGAVNASEILETLKRGAPEKTIATLNRAEILPREKIAAALNIGDDLLNQVPNTPIANTLLSIYTMGKTLKLGKKLPAPQKTLVDKLASVAKDAVLWHTVGAPGFVVSKLLGNVTNLEAHITKALGKALSKASVGTKSTRAKTVKLSAQSILMNTQFAPKKEKGPAMKARLKEINETVSNPLALSTTLNNSLKPLIVHNPELGNMAVQTATRKFQYLQATAPKSPTMDRPGRITKWEPNPVEVKQWSNRIHAADNPVQALAEGIQRGDLAIETVETVKAIYPEIYLKFQTNLMNQVASLQEDLPYSKRVILSVLFDVPVEPLADPLSVAFLQNIHLPQEGEQAAASFAPGTARKEEPTKGQQLAER